VLVESHLSIAPREGIDFFAKRDEYLLLCPVEIRIDEAVQVAGETRKETKSHQPADDKQIHLTTVTLEKGVWAVVVESWRWVKPGCHDFRSYHT
jgi:hypothetical protein